MEFIKLFFKKLRLYPTFLFYVFYDWLLYRHYRKKLLFSGWGIHLFTGKFGAGKTSLMVIKAYELCEKYPQLSVLTNLTLYNFPSHTQILPLNSIDDILDAPKNTLVLLDEIGTIFNSRDFMSSKKGNRAVPKSLFQHLAQCRHRRIMVFGSVQRFCLLDKQIRDISDSVTECRSSFRHPFCRMLTGVVYNIDDYEALVQNPLYIAQPMETYVYLQTEKYRHLYDTMEMVKGFLSMEFYSDEEILSSRGEVPLFSDGSKEAQRAYRKSLKNRRR